jgi:hypothetical protein
MRAFLSRILDHLTRWLLGVTLPPPEPVIAPLIEPAGIADLELRFRQGQVLALVRRRWMAEATLPAGQNRAVMDLCLDVQRLLQPPPPTAAELREPPVGIHPYR